MNYCPSRIEEQRRHRVRASLFAYAYEIMNVSLVSDEEYDKICLQIDTSISTGNNVMDEFFRKEFNPSTGMWIHNHPNLESIKRIYNSLIREVRLVMKLLKKSPKKRIK